ncbi:hypothetical protein NPIL_694671 [Nephila pilipes]|uniref:Uncharacterized protein n=1 Tax=Nephila pilipes TaxID=299642 RepID=A0A8X6TVI8_NEPPI|nr:hypothetical protein NPIL_694671 [Nephila pilipes]
MQYCQFKISPCKLSFIEAGVDLKHRFETSLLNSLKKTYKKMIILKYDSEALISAPQNKVDILERAQNKALRLITEAEVSIPMLALRHHTSFSPVAVEIKKQAVNAHVRMKASVRANWTNDWQKSLLKTRPLRSKFVRGVCGTWI